MIREVRRDELSACADLIRKSFQTVADQFGFTEQNAPRFTAFATTEERLLRHMDTEHRLMYLDEESGMICGYYSLLLHDHGECELGSLSVLPGYRHRGTGGRLLRHAVKTAREHGCAVMKLSIVEENTVLRKWYERSGAVHTGTEKFDFFPFTCGYMEINLNEQPPAYRIRQVTIDDYDRIYDLWNSTEQSRRALNPVDDSREGIDRYLKRNPATCFAAVTEDRLIGVILAGHDGRRGLIHHMCVHPDFRRMGIAARLVSAAEEALENEGIQKVFGLVFIDNEAANAFWEKQGYSLRTNLNYRNKSLNEMIPTGK